MEYDIEATIYVTVEADDKEKAEIELNSLLPMNSSIDLISIKETQVP